MHSNREYLGVFDRNKIFRISSKKNMKFTCESCGDVEDTVYYVDGEPAGVCWCRHCAYLVIQNLEKLERYEPKADAWIAKFVSFKEIVSDYESKSEEERADFKFIVGVQEVSYINSRTNEILYEAMLFEIIEEILHDLTTFNVELTKELLDKIR